MSVNKTTTTIVVVSYGRETTRRENKVENVHLENMSFSLKVAVGMPRISILIKICLVIFISGGSIGFWYNEAWKKLEPTMQVAQEPKYDICQWKFNQELEYPRNFPYFSPYSVFHHDSLLTIIFSRRKSGIATVENFNSDNYYTTISWKIRYENKQLGAIEEVLCQPIKSPDADPYLLIVQCKAEAQLPFE